MLVCSIYRVIHSWSIIGGEVQGVLKWQLLVNNINRMMRFSQKRLKTNGICFFMNKITSFIISLNTWDRNPDMLQNQLTLIIAQTEF